MYDITTFGSATRDVFLKSKGFEEREEKRFFSKRGIFISLGSKIPVEEIHFLTGGGGTNTAFTFKNQGFKVSFCGMVGNDFAGKEIIKELKRKKIPTDFLFINKKHHTNYSIVLATKDERTLLVYRGASEKIQEKDVPWQRLKAKWFYLAPLSGNALRLFEPILKFAKKNSAKIALNPGKSQLSLPKKKLKKMLNLADIVILNQEEASFVTELPYHREKKIFKTLDDWVDGIVVMTKGPFGVVVSNGKWLYRAGILKTKKIVDRTGCGDAFGSGFVAGLIRATRNRQTITSRSIEYAIQFGSANATSCLQKLGAKNGLIKKGDNILKWGKVKIGTIKL